MITTDLTLITSEHRFLMTKTWHKLYKGTLVGIYTPEILKAVSHLSYNNKLIRVIKLGIPLSKGISDSDWNWVPIELLKELEPPRQFKGMKPEFPPPSVQPK